MKKNQVLFFVGLALAGSSHTQGQLTIVIHASGSTEYVVTDPLQRRAGFDPIANKRYTEINNSYGVFSIDSEDPDIDPPEPVNEFASDDTLTGVFHLTLYGTKPARYRLSILIDVQNKGKSVETFGTIDSGQTRLFTFEYPKDSTVPFTLKKLVTGRNIREDLMNCYKLKFLGDQSLYKELTEHIDHIDKRLERNDSSKAVQELVKLGEKLRNVREETIKHEERRQKGNRFVTTEAYAVLTDDIVTLMASLGGNGRKGRDKVDH